MGQDSSGTSKRKEILEEIARQKEDKTKIFEEEKVFLVIFSLAKEWYGIKIQSVIEIIKLPNITSLPQVPEYILGVINLRGEIIPLIDLRRLFNITVTPFGRETRILVVEADNIRVGLVVDSVSEVVAIPMSHIDSPLSTLDRIKAEYIYGEIKMDERFLAVIHLENIVKEAVARK